METAEKALFMGFGFAALLLVFAAVLVWKGTNTFQHGVGLKRLADHKFELELAGFKLNTVVSSVGGLMIVGGIIFASIGAYSVPNYEANLMTGVRRVAEIEPAIPRQGMVATTISGNQVILDDVSDTKALTAAWGPYNSVTLTRALGAPVGKDFLAAYAKLVKENPNLVVVVDYGGPIGLAGSGVGTMNDVVTTWSNAFKDIGLNENQIIVVPKGDSKAVWPTVSIAKPEG